MARTIRYFSTSAAGAGDGTSWANRAALFSAGNWSTVITGFDFSTNAMEARIGPGTYSCSQVLNTTTITTDPTLANFLLLHGCDGSGNLLDAPDQTWRSCGAQFSDATFPVIATASNINTIATGANILLRCLKVTASATNGAILSATECLDFVVAINSTSNTSATVISASHFATNCWFECSASTYEYVANITTCFSGNCRYKGPSGSSGNRRGVQLNGSIVQYHFNSTVSGTQAPWISISTAAGQTVVLHNCLGVNGGGSGFQLSTTAHTSGLIALFRCMATGNGAYGYQPNESLRVTFYDQCRFRDNTSGSVGTDLSRDWGTNYTTDTDDATEYFHPTGDDYTIRASAASWGGHYGAAERPLGTYFTTGNWTNFDEATWTNPGAALTDFTGLINIANLSSSWKAAIQSDGGDIRLTKSDNTELPFDLINFAYNAGSPTGWIRVKWTGTLSNSGTQKIRVWAGYTPTGDAFMYDVSAPYGGHLAYDSSWYTYWPGYNTQDRTKNQKHLTANGGVTVGGATGKVGAGTTFDGTDDYLSFVGTTNNVGFNLSTIQTVEAWYKIPTFDDFVTHGILGYETSGLGTKLRLRVNEGSDDAITFDPSDTATAVTSADLTNSGAFVHVAAARNGASRRIYRAGTDIGGTEAGDASANFIFNQIGRESTTAYFKGVLNEVKTHTAKRSADWIAEEYAQSNNNATFWGTWTWGGAGGPITLVIQDALHGHSTDASALTQDHFLIIADASHAHSTDAVALTQLHLLVIADALHAHAADNSVLTQESTLVVADTLHDHAADNLTLTQLHILAIADALHAHAAENLDLTQTSILAIADALHGHSVDNLTLTQLHLLLIQDALHDHTAENVNLTQLGDLVVQEASHGHTADNAALTQDHQLVISDSGHAHTSDNVDLSQTHILVVFDGEHAHLVDNVDLTQQHYLNILDATHGHSADNVDIEDLTVSDIGEVIVARLRPSIGVGARDSIAWTSVRESIAVAIER